MKRLVLAMVLAAGMAAAKQPVPEPVLVQEYSGVTQDEVFASMVGIVANFHITLVVKEACLVKMSSLPVSREPVVEWTLKCSNDPIRKGIVIRIVAQTTPRATGVPVEFASMDRNDQEHVAKTVGDFWMFLSTELGKDPMVPQFARRD